jgi:hypothetical protein
LGFAVLLELAFEDDEEEDVLPFLPAPPVAPALGPAFVLVLLVPVFALEPAFALVLGYFLSNGL